MTTAPLVTSDQLPPMEAELEGYAWLPRMLAKARATLAGTASGFMFGCPVDHTLMARLGVSPELVLELVGRYDRDADVLEALRAHGVPPAADAWFDAVAVEDELQEQGTYLRVRRRDALPVEHGVGVFSGAEHGARVSVLLVDAAPGEAEAWHSHPVEEVVVVHDGEATFFLGELQRRIVREGEVVRIPAGVAHRFANTGTGRFRAVAAHGAAKVVTEPAAGPAEARPA
jgi:quercetin dioxygenase-like cupin family protein